MGKKSRKKKESQDIAADSIPDLCFRCSRCGRPWLKGQAFPHKGDTLCFPCHEEFVMAVAQAAYEVDQAQFLLDRERQKHAHKN